MVVWYLNGELNKKIKDKPLVITPWKENANTLKA